ncbi:MAG: GHKL domain-containing protein [Eubacterium sp.]
MEYFYIGLVYFFEFLITISFCNRVMDKRLKTSQILIFTFPLYVLGFALYFVFENVFVNTCVSVVMYLCTMLIGYKETIIKKVVYTAYLVICMYLSEILFAVTLYDRFQVVMNNENLSSIMQGLIGITSKLINFILVQLLVLLIKHKDFKQNAKFLPLFIYPMTSMAFVVAIAWLSEKYAFAKSDLAIVVIISLIDAIMCVVIFMYYGFLEEKDREIKQLEKEQQFVELNNSYMQVLEHQNNELQMVFHDTKHHFMAIENMDNIDDVKAYASKLYPQLENQNHINISNNKMLDLLLNKYIVICKSKGISFNYDVKTVSLDYIDNSELSILICNILDNAIESAVQSTDKTVNLSLKRIGNMDLLSVENSCDTPPKHKGNKLITSKGDKQNHGYGTKIIERHAKQNNGKYEWFYDENDKRFHLNVLFKNKRG